MENKNFKLKNNFEEILRSNGIKVPKSKNIQRIFFHKWEEVYFEYEHYQEVTRRKLKELEKKLNYEFNTNLELEPLIKFRTRKDLLNLLRRFNRENLDSLYYKKRRTLLEQLIRNLKENAPEGSRYLIIERKNITFEKELLNELTKEQEEFVLTVKENVIEKAVVSLYNLDKKAKESAFQSLNYKDYNYSYR